MGSEVIPLAATSAPAGSLAASAYAQLKADLLTCRLAPGAVVQAAEQAARLQMSRTPVHEALKALCQEGFMRVVRRTGYLVTPMKIEDIEEIFYLREQLEVPAAGLAAERATDEDVARLREQQKKEVKRAEAAGDSLDEPGLLESFIEGNRDFHLAIANLAGKPRLARILAGLLDEGQRIHFLYFRYSLTGHVEDHHQHLIDALAAKDAKAARSAMAAHIRDMRKGTLTQVVP